MIKSQSDLNPCNDGKRSSEVLLATVAKCERLQKQLDIAIKALEKYSQKTEHIVAHNEYTTTVEYRSYNDGGRVAQTALAEIKELDK